MTTEKDILLRFREIFRSTTLTKSEFAYKLGIHHRSLNRYINGEYDIQKISKKLIRKGYSIDWLYTGKGKKYFGDTLDSDQLESLLSYNIIVQKKRVYKWICDNYENIIEFEISRHFTRYEVQDIFENDDSIPYLILRRIENSGCNIYWSMTGNGSSYADNDCGKQLKEKHE